MNPYYENYFKKAREKAANKRQEKRSFGEQLFPMFITFTVGTILIHIVSFLAAIIFPAFQLKVLTGNSFLGLIIGAVFIFSFIEIPKYVAIKTVFENFFDSETKSYGLTSLACFCITVSILSSTYGSELAFKWFAPSAELQSIEAIENKYGLEKEQELQFWSAKIDGHKVEAKNYFKQNAKYYTSEDRTRLSSAKTVKEPYNKMLASLSNAESTLSTRLLEIEANKTKAISEAIKGNALLSSKDSKQKDKSSMIAFWIMLLLELTYVAGIGFIAYYKYRSDEELNGLEIQPTQTEQPSTGKVVQLNNQTEPNQQGQPVKKQSVVTATTEPNPIGYKSHGSVFVPEGGSVAKVWYQTAKGGWTTYSASDLKRMVAKDTGSDEWKNDLGELIGKIESFQYKK